MSLQSTFNQNLGLAAGIKTAKKVLPAERSKKAGETARKNVKMRQSNKRRKMNG